MNEKLPVPQGPQRIVCMTEETTEWLYLLGQEHRIVGISGYTVRPPRARAEKPRVSAFTSAKIDKIMALQPDCVFGFSDMQADIASALICQGVQVTIVSLDGAVESAVKLGVADAVADVVSTGSTLRAQGLEIFGPVILDSTAVLISAHDQLPGITTLQRRLQGVLVARQYVLMDYDVRLEHLEQATAVTPGLESPTISPMQDPEWVAVRAMVPRADTNQVMDALYEVGARAILVSSIHAARI